jgi:uncharacterized C2H2 Zn-finger protein
MLNWLRRPKYGTIERRDTPDGLWAKCPKCGAVVYHKDLIRARVLDERRIGKRKGHNLSRKLEERRGQPSRGGQQVAL